jgi:hypothetical protein
MTFHEGDKVRRRKGTGNCCTAMEFVTYTIQNRSGSLEIGTDTFNLCSCQSDWELITNNITNITNMNPLEKFALMFKSEPEKSFRSTGITNGDDFLTGDGQKIFLSWLLKKHGTEFKKEVVDELLSEIKKDK